MKASILLLLLGLAVMAPKLTAGEVPKELSPEAMKAVAISAPRPEYPYEARRMRVTGSGVAVVHVDKKTGVVTEAVMAKSTGSPILDDAALSAFRRWRFTPGSVTAVRLPINFSMNGGNDPNRLYSYGGTVTAINLAGQYIAVQVPTGRNPILLLMNRAKMTKNSRPLTGLANVSVGDQVEGLAKVTRERLGIAASANFTSPRR